MLLLSFEHLNLLTLWCLAPKSPCLPTLHLYFRLLAYLVFFIHHNLTMLYSYYRHKIMQKYKIQSWKKKGF